MKRINGEMSLSEESKRLNAALARLGDPVVGWSKRMEIEMMRGRKRKEAKERAK